MNASWTCFLSQQACYGTNATEYNDEYDEPEDHDGEWIDMSGIPEDATFEEPELACMLENIQKGKKGRARVSGEARRAGAQVSPVMF